MNPFDQIKSFLGHEGYSGEKHKKLDRTKTYSTINREIFPYNDDIDLVKSEITQNKKISRNLVQGVARYIHKEYYNSESRADLKSRCALKAEYALGLVKTDKSRLKNPDFSKINPETIILRSITQGYNNFRFKTPWHASAFLEGNLRTFPYNHSSAILYHGGFKNFFWKRESKNKEKFKGISMRGFESARNRDSILEKGYIGPTKEYEKPKLGTSVTAMKGLHFGFLELAVDAGGEIVYEVEIPTDELFMEDKGNTNVKRNKGAMNSLEEMLNQYEDPENLLRRIEGYQSENIQFGVSHMVPLEWVRRVGLMPENSNSVDINFMPLNQYVKKLYNDYPEKLPEHRFKEERLTLEKDLRVLWKLTEILETINITLNRMKEACEKYREGKRKGVELTTDSAKSEIKNALGKYSEELNTFKQKTDSNIQTLEANNIQDLEKIVDNILSQNLEKEISKLRSEIQYQRKAEASGNKEAIEKSRKLETKETEQFSSLKLPFIKFQS